jgi:hypothetical protein
MALPPIARGGNPSGRGLEDSGIINGSEMIAGNSCLIFFFYCGVFLIKSFFVVFVKLFKKFCC